MIVAYLNIVFILSTALFSVLMAITISEEL